MLRFLGRKTQKSLPLGRWNTDKAITVKMRLADLANYDSCGTCGIPESKPPVDKYIGIEDDVIDIGYMAAPGSFHVNTNKQK